VRPTPGADSSAFLLVPNVKVRIETQHYIPPSHDLLREGFTFTFTHTILRCVSPRAGLEDMEKAKYLVPFLCLLELAIKSHGT
jgi:hypothetical protein